LILPEENFLVTIQINTIILEWVYQWCKCKSLQI